MPPPVVQDKDRLAHAEALLRDAVFRSREKQSAVAALRAPVTKNANCGLGERAEIDLDLSARGRDALDQLHPEGLNAEVLDAVRLEMASWVERQDTLDRKRNHFLKEFRARHGFNRRDYAPGVAGEFEAGLARINAEEDAEREVAARRILAAGS
jgi:hypothetical protein